MELIVVPLACFIFMIAGAVIGSVAASRVSEDVVKPVVQELHY